MIFIDIPMYYERHLESMHNGICINLNDYYVDTSKEVWLKEIPWMSGYFVLGSLTVIYLAYFHNNRYKSL